MFTGLSLHSQPQQQWSSGDVNVPVGMLAVPQQQRGQQRIQFVAPEMQLVAGPYAYGPGPQYIDHQAPNQYSSVQYETYQLADGSMVQVRLCKNSSKNKIILSFSFFFIIKVSFFLFFYVFYI